MATYLKLQFLHTMRNSYTKFPGKTALIFKTDSKQQQFQGD